MFDSQKESHSSQLYKRRSARSKPWHTFAAIGIVLIFLLVFINPSSPYALSGLSGTSATNTRGVIVTKPFQVTCIDPLAAANCGAVTIATYQGNTPNLLESGTASSSGLLTSSNSYTSGTQVTLKISGNSKVTEFIPVTLPTAYITDTNLVFTVYAVTLGTWLQILTGNNGATTFVSGSQYALSGYSGNQVTITDTLTDSTSNAGYKASYDTTNLINQYFIIQMDDGAGASSSSQYATVSGLPHTVKQGNTNYYFTVCPDGLVGSGVGSQFNVQPNSQSAGSFDSVCSGSLTVRTIGNQVFGGAVSFSYTIALGSLATGNVETFQSKMQYYGDWAYFVLNGNLGPNVAQSGTTFTLKFNK